MPNITTKAQYICNICDRVSSQGQGDPLVLTLFEQYPYATCYQRQDCTLGTINICSPPKPSQPTIINMFTKFNAGKPMPPYDTHERRLQWFTKALTHIELKLSTELTSLAFPANLPTDFIEQINDFQKKHYLTYRSHLIIVDYQDQPLIQAPMISINIAPPITRLYIPSKLKLKPKPKLKLTPRVSSPSPSGSSQTYDCNLQWPKLISSLAYQTIDATWLPIFQAMKPLLEQLDQQFNHEMEHFGDAIEILPRPPHLIFNAFRLTPFNQLKVIIIGQDPYYAHLNEAMGLSFSVPQGVTVPPSLVNIFKELGQEYSNFKTPQSGNLTSWARQGVLLLNSSLTVRYKQKGSHLKYWRPITDQLIKLISQKANYPLIFMLWGNYAKAKKKLIDLERHQHHILEAVHPSPLSATRGGWFGCRHFVQANNLLSQNNQSPINWNLLI